MLKICRKYLGDNYHYNKIISQLSEYTTNIGLTYEQIADILKYWYEIKKNDPVKSGGGIGIVPYIYKEALKYWKKEKEYQEKMANIKPYSPPEVEHIVAPSPYMTKPKTLKMFDLK